MKVLKVVGEGAERKTYVEDGLACPEMWLAGGSWEYGCGGTGIATHRVFRGGVMVAKPGGPCFHCHGTGFKAVEDWTDAVKAEWLSNNISDHLSWAIENGYYVYTICQGEFTGEKETELAENDDFSAALTAAVIAVAEGDK